jgi:hypothetical protein
MALNSGPFPAAIPTHCKAGFTAFIQAKNPEFFAFGAITDSWRLGSLWPDFCLTCKQNPGQQGGVFNP